MTWVERLMGPSRAPRAAKAPQQMSVDLAQALRWFDGMTPEALGAVRYSTDLARHTQPGNAKAHAAFAAASIAAARAGLCEDLPDDVSLACAAAEQALRLEPQDPIIMALAAPAIVNDDPARARALFKIARRKLGRRVPASLVRAASEGALRS